MADVAVDHWRFEWQGSVRAIAEVEPDLTRAKQVEVIDQETHGRNRQDTDDKQANYEVSCQARRDLPNDRVDGAPLPHEEREDHVGDEHVGAALNRLGNPLRPDGLEGGAGHDRMLRGK